jgi:hypothetical protein
VKLRVGGQPVRSPETRWLRQDHAAALRELREHRRKCIQCGQATRRRGGEPCLAGSTLRDVEAELQARAREAERLDASPPPPRPGTPVLR